MEWINQNLIFLKAFQDKGLSFQRPKQSFPYNIWDWVNMLIDQNIDSIVAFID